MRINLMSEEDAFNLQIGDYIYDSKNRKVKIVNKNSSTYLIEKYRADNIKQNSYLVLREILQDYTIHKKE
jgi:hypothetical protein